MTDQLISFITAKLAKEKGFNILVNSNFNNLQELETTVNKIDWNNTDITRFPVKYSAPTQSLLQKWLREKHDIFININTSDNKLFCIDINKEYYYDCGRDDWFKSYEEALEQALKEGLLLIK